MEPMDISPDSTPKLIHNKGDKELKSPVHGGETSPQRSGAKSPDNNCSICLGKFDNKSFTDACFHTFCFVCILEWSKVKATCPLCKTSFNSIIHNIKSNELYDQYYLPVTENGSVRVGNSDAARFRYRTTQMDARRSQLLHRRNLIVTRSRYRAQRKRFEVAAMERRRLVYAFGLRPQQNSSRRSSRLRDISAEFYRANPACIHRLVPWLRREMTVLFSNNESHVNFMTSMVLSYVSHVDMESEEFLQYLRPFLYHRTEQFVSELISFARSLNDMTTYDQTTTYTSNMEQTAVPVRRDIPLISLSPDNTTSSSDNPSLSPVQSHSTGYITNPVLGGSTIDDLPSTSSMRLLSDLSYTHNPEPPSVPGDIQEYDTVASDHSDDVVFVGCVKPPGERTPEAVITLSSDTEVELDVTPSQGKQKHIRSRRSRDRSRNQTRARSSHRDRSSSDERYHRSRSSSHSDRSGVRNKDISNKPGGKRKQKTKHVRNSKHRHTDHVYHKSRRETYTSDTDSDYELPLSHSSSSTYRHSRHRYRSRSRSRSPARDYRYKSRTTKETYTYGGHQWHTSSSSSTFSRISTSASSKNYATSRSGHTYYDGDSEDRSRSRSRGPKKHQRSRSRSTSTASHRRSCSVEFMGSFPGKNARTKHTFWHGNSSNTYRLTGTDSDVEVTHVKSAVTEERSRKKKKHKHRKRKHRHEHRHKHKRKRRDTSLGRLHSEEQVAPAEKLLSQINMVTSQKLQSQIHATPSDKLQMETRLPLSDALPLEIHEGTSDRVTPEIPEGTSDRLTPEIQEGTSDRLMPEIHAGTSDRLMPEIHAGTSDRLTPEIHAGTSDRLMPEIHAGTSDRLTPEIPEVTPGRLKPEGHPVSLQSEIFEDMTERVQLEFPEAASARSQSEMTNDSSDKCRFEAQILEAPSDSRQFEIVDDMLQAVHNDDKDTSPIEQKDTIETAEIQCEEQKDSFGADHDKSSETSDVEGHDNQQSDSGFFQDKTNSQSFSETETLDKDSKIKLLSDQSETMSDGSLDSQSTTLQKSGISAFDLLVKAERERLIKLSTADKKSEN
ncbi:E3 ubiquitin-protein ligase Topors-like [Ptychodera flava]|uniref:E3 ubiquitin-protein ligase Topors-like n=1 Tax=Ptychodera flava TaxID=63121 RepID=UPI00396A55AA